MKVNRKKIMKILFTGAIISYFTALFFAIDGIVVYMVPESDYPLSDNTSLQYPPREALGQTLLMLTYILFMISVVFSVAYVLLERRWYNGV